MWPSRLWLHPLSTACSYGISTDVIPSPLYTPSSSVSACLRTAGPYLLCVTGSITAADIWREKHRLRIQIARFMFRKDLTGEHRDFRVIARCRWSSFFFLSYLPWHPSLSCLCGWLTADFMVLSRLVWLKACGQGGICGAADRETSVHCPVPCTVIVNGLRSLRDFLQSLWVICGRRWRTGLRCFPYPPSILSRLLDAGKSSYVKWQWGVDGGCAGLIWKGAVHVGLCCFDDCSKNAHPQPRL